MLWEQPHASGKGITSIFVHLLSVPVGILQHGVSAWIINSHYLITVLSNVLIKKIKIQYISYSIKKIKHRY